MRWSLAAVAGLVVGCAARRAPFEGYRQLQEPAASPEVVRLVLVGDTGAEPDGEGSHIGPEAYDRLRASIRAEQADGIFAMGDLVYGVGGPLELAPRCRDPQRPRAAALLDGRLGRYYADLGAPAWLVLGNHDVGHFTYSRQRARCLIAYAEQQEHLRLPAAKYAVDYGLAKVVVVDTNVPPKRWDAEALAAASGGDGQWTVMVGHHVLQASFDKEDEQLKAEHRYKDWLLDAGLQPDLWANGHAHFLQLGVYDGIPAATSGSGAKIRERTACPGDDCTADGLPMFSRSVYGYALVELREDTLSLQFKDDAGETLWCWERDRSDPQGRPCPEDAPAPAPAAVASGASIHLWGAFNQHDHEQIIAARAGEVVARSAEAGLDGELAYLVAAIPERNSAANITGMSPHAALIGPEPGPLLEQAREQGWGTPMLMLAVVPAGTAPAQPQAVALQVSEGGAMELAEGDVVRLDAQLRPAPAE